MSNKIAILGAGNGGVTAAADLSLKGYSVNLYELPEFFGNTKKIRENGGVLFKKNNTEEFVSFNLITDNIEEALKEVSIVIITVPSTAIEIFAKKAAPYIENGQNILLNGAASMSSYRFARVVRAIRGHLRFGIGETASLTYASRVMNGEVNLSLEVNKLLFAAYPSEDTKKLLSIFKELYPSLVPAENIWETLLHNGNPETHAGPSLLNAGRIEYSEGEFYLYKEGITPMVSNVIRSVSKERKKICDRLDIRYKDTPDRMLELGYSEKWDELYRMYNNSDVFKEIKGPLSLNSRYFTEDISDGLVLWSSLGKELDIATPNIDAIIILYSSIVERDFMKEGLTLEKLGLSNLSPTELLDHV